MRSLLASRLGNRAAHAQRSNHFHHFQNIQRAPTTTLPRNSTEWQTKEEEKKSVYALRRAQSTCEYIRFIKRLAFFLHKIFSFTFSTCFVLLLHLDKAELRVATSMHDIIIGAVFANSKIECTIYDMFFHCFDEWICVKSANECFPLQDEQRPVEVCSDIIAKTWI